MGAKRAPAERVEARSTLTAVLLADSFTQRFRPITVECPKALLPLLNVPMIEYTLEWLAMNHVEEVFVFCCAHAQRITEYLASSKWGSGGSSSSGGSASAGGGAAGPRSEHMRVTTIVSTNCLSAGEAMRIIDQRDIIKGDFILVSGDTVSNMDLAPALAAHRARRQVDKNAIMTMVFKPARHPHQRLRLGESELLVTQCPSTGRLLQYAELEGGDKLPPALKVDCSLFSERDAVQVRTDLVDTHIAICSHEVLLLFSDNFDYQNLRRDFVTGVLSEEELGNKLYTYVLPSNEYAARIHNLRSYDAVSRDLMQRWAFPFTPDTNVLFQGGTWGAGTYHYGRGQRYIESNVQQSRSAVVGEDVCIGAGTSLADNCYVAQSVIGRGVRVGRGCVVVGSYIQDGAVLQDGVVVKCAMVCANAVLRQGAVVEPGCLISYGVVVGQRCRVPNNTRLSLCQQLARGGNDSDDELEYAAVGALAPNKPSAVPRGLGPQGRLHKGVRTHGRSGLGRAGADDDDDDDDDDEDDDDDVAGPSDDLDGNSGHPGHEDDDGSSTFSADHMAASLERPSSGAIKAAEALAMGRPLSQDETGVVFDEKAVGLGGAGFRWKPKDDFDVARYSIAAPNIAEIMAAAAAAEAAGAELAAAAISGEASGRLGASSSAPGAGGSGSDEDEDEETDPERIWKSEVEETFLRCLKQRFDPNNVVIELNGLKIAEDRTFADCGRYMLTTLLSLGLPPPPRRKKDEYSALFATAAPDVSTNAGKLALLKGFKTRLAQWKELLCRFLRSDDDQIELLLTLEEYCGGEGTFEADGDGGKAYASVFPQVLKELYDTDVVSEDAVLAWADEKEHCTAEERVFLEKASAFVEWLREDDEEDEDEEWESEDDK